MIEEGEKVVFFYFGSYHVGDVWDMVERNGKTMLIVNSGKMSHEVYENQAVPLDRFLELVWKAEFEPCSNCGSTGRIDPIENPPYECPVCEGKSYFIGGLAKDPPKPNGFTVYLAGPISGQSFDDVVSYFMDTKKRLESMGYRVLHPMTGKSALRNEVEFRAEGYGNPTSTNRAIRGRDHWMVKMSDILFMNFSNAGDRVSIGSVSELSWAFEMGKHSVVIMPETHKTHRHAFVLDQADIIFETAAEGFDYLEKLGSGEV